MLEREALLEDIRKGLAVLRDYLRPAGGLNLTDANVHAESFVAGLLNAIYAWKLAGTNQEKANYPCVDLIDKDGGLAVQVTSEKGSAKLNDTVGCLKRHGFAGKIHRLKVFSVTSKQTHYTVNAECPGVAFDWRDDVLDFDDVIKAAQGISDLAQLQRIHQHVVDSLPAIFPARVPSLNIPATDPAVAWLAFSSRATRLIGREAEVSRLLEFLNSVPKFSWWLVTGAAGSGKSRLALELCHHAASEWNAGFLSRTEKDFKWSQFSSSQKVFVVIDYVASRAREVGDAVLTLCRASSRFTRPVRVLLVERDKGSWWTAFSREDSGSESAEMATYMHDEPLGLSGLPPKSILQLAEEVVRARNGNWNAALAQEFLQRLYHYDPRGRPLFAMIVAQYLRAVEADDANTNLLQIVLKREAARRRTLIQEPEKLSRMENLMLLATAVSGLRPKANSFDYLATSNVAGLLPDVALLNEVLYNEMVGSAGDYASFGGLQPDILGERFILDRMSATGIAGLNARKLLFAAWSFQPEDLRVVAVRSAFDFHGDQGLYKLFDLPLDSSEQRAHWAGMVGDLVAFSGGIEDHLSAQQLQKLMQVADSHPQERELQEATALADYNIGRGCMFRENGVPVAIERFDAVVARVGNDSLIAKMAIHNRGILNHQSKETDKAFAAYTMMIEFREAPDEMRACAYNNRADVYAERGDHENAIRDRSEVLALKETSFDRRFIALFRRSRSYVAIGNDQAALDDLGQIQETWDITPPQKADARLERGLILRRLKRWNEARADLESVIEARHLFPGTRVRAILEMADLSRRTGDHAKAESFLASAAEDPEASAEIMIEVRIVRAQLLEDTGHIDKAKEIWRSVIDASDASVDQVQFAKAQLDAIRP